MKKLLNNILSFLDRLTEDNVSAYSAQAAFFMMLSIFPFILVLLTIISYTKFSPEVLIANINGFLPESLSPLMSTIFYDMRMKASGVFLSFTVLTAIWSASRGVFALTSGLNSAYHVSAKSNFLLTKLLSAVYTLLFCLIILLTLVIQVFGNTLHSWASSKFPELFNISLFIISLRTTVTVSLLLLFFLFVYRFLPNKHISLIYDLPGALFSAIGWSVISYLSSIYVDNIDSFSYMYGSMASIVIFMLWLHLCMFIVITGAELNAVLYERHRNALQKEVFYGKKYPPKKPFHFFVQWIKSAYERLRSKQQP